jgi:plastocyanin
MVSLPAGLAAQDANSAAEACRSMEETASPTAEATESPEASPAAEACTIEIREIAYHPAETEIAAGTTVTWKNSDTVPHSATSTDGVFDSDIFDPGKSFSFTFDEAGTFDYTCLVHPKMKGTIVVR